MNVSTPEDEVLPMAKLPYGFRIRMLHLVPFKNINKYIGICALFEKIFPLDIDPHEQVFITDHQVVGAKAKEDTFLFRIWKCLDQFEFCRNTFDGILTIYPVWKSVLMVDEIIDCKNKIYVNDTLILNCEIQGYENVSPKIFGPYTRLVLHGTINLSQVLRLMRPSVKHVRINARLQIEPEEYDDFVRLVVNHIRGVEYTFSFDKQEDNHENLLMQLKNTCRYYATHHVRHGTIGMVYVIHKNRELHQVYYACGSMFASILIAVVVPLMFLHLPGSVTCLYPIQEPHINAVARLHILSFLFVLIISYIFTTFVPMCVDDVSKTVVPITPSNGFFTKVKRFLWNSISPLVIGPSVN